MALPIGTRKQGISPGARNSIVSHTPAALAALAAKRG
jgi:hypothetical protein